MNEIDIEAWVDAAPADQRGFREAVHIILDSIGHSQNLKARMVMKGGLLLAIRYDSEMYFEGALVMVLFGFVGSVAMAKFLLRGEVV